MIPEFMRFYRYSLADVLDMYAVSFFALMNSYYKLYALERMARITDVAVSQSDSQDANSIREGLERQSKGVDDILRQAKVLREIK